MYVGQAFIFKGKAYKVKEIHIDNTDYKYVITTDNKTIYVYEIENDNKPKVEKKRRWSK